MPDIKKVVVADDESNLGLLTKMVLESAGLEVTLTSNGQEAFEACQKIKPDLLVSDYLMPQLNGVELCKKIKLDQSLQNVRIILMSALTDQTSDQNFKTCGADAFLAKPFGAQELKQLSHQLLKGS